MLCQRLSLLELELDACKGLNIIAFYSCERLDIIIPLDASERLDLIIALDTCEGLNLLALDAREWLDVLALDTSERLNLVVTLDACKGFDLVITLNSCERLDFIVALNAGKRLNFLTPDTGKGLYLIISNGQSYRSCDQKSGHERSERSLHDEKR